MKISKQSKRKRKKEKKIDTLKNILPRETAIRGHCAAVRHLAECHSIKWVESCSEPSRSRRHCYALVFTRLVSAPRFSFLWTSRCSSPVIARPSCPEREPSPRWQSCHGNYLETRAVAVRASVRWRWNSRQKARGRERKRRECGEEKETPVALLLEYEPRGRLITGHRGKPTARKSSPNLFRYVSW